MKLFCFALACAFLWTVPAAAQKKPVSTPLPVNDTKKSAYEFAVNDPLNARVYTLSNGMKVYLSVYKDAPRIQTYIAVRAGSKNDPASATGLAHYLEHMVFKGTDKFGTKNWAKESAEIKKIEALYEVYRKTTDEAKRKAIYHQIDSVSGVAAKYAIANEYDKMLAAIGASGTNAYTDFDETVYVNDIPSNQIDNWLKIESERFHKLVLRLFHTELEAVYEEKNRSLDNDDYKVYDAVMNGLFSNHTYGTQTGLGTIEHLKNPSMTEINKFYDKYYVPNNMAIVMSGDLDPDKTIASIEKYFGSMKAKPVEAYQYQPEKPIQSKIVKEVIGPDPAAVTLAWRFAGADSRDEDLCKILSAILYNGNAGLIDLNLNQAQKILAGNTDLITMNDYCIFSMGGQPKEGQTLEQVENLLMGQIDLIKKGEFPDWLLKAVITDFKLDKTKELEQNQTRATEMLNSFVSNSKWQNSVDRLDRLSKITKQEIIDFANKNFTNGNYVVVYKRTGEDNSVQKVEKPEITPVELDLDNTSPFVKSITSSVAKPIEPKFIDFEKDILKAEIKPGVQLLYNKNSENRLFELNFKFDMGKSNDKTLPFAVDYVPFLATKNMSAADVTTEFYKLGCSMEAYCDNDNVWLRLSGLSDNFEPALQLFEKLISEPLVDENVLKNMLDDKLKGRRDQKLQKSVILNSGMTNYALFGPVNPFSYVLSDAEINKLGVEDIRSRISGLFGYEHKILYYGPESIDKIKSVFTSKHLLPVSIKPVPKAMQFDMKQLDNTVYVVDYDMKQAEIVMLSNGGDYDPTQVPITSLYNTYFGEGMSSVVFQDLRESKALAYSTSSRFSFSRKKERKNFNQSYIGSQADKLPEAIKGMKDLLTTLPKSENNFAASKEMLLQDLRTQRITKSEIMFYYLSSLDMGNTTDIRKDVFEKVKLYTFDDVKKFHAQNISNKTITTLVLGKKSSLDMKTLEKQGPVKFLTLTDLFGF